MKTLIIQSGFPRSASTLLVNALLGLLMLDQPVQFNDFVHNFNYDYDAPLNVFKTHDVNIDQLDAVFGSDFQTYFVCSERVSSRFDNRFRDMPNAVFIDYEELVQPVPIMCGRLHDRVAAMIPWLPVSAEACMDRVDAMNARYEEIKRLPFSYVDPYFNIHGSHRLRPKLRGGSI